MKYLLMLVAAILVVGCGENPAGVVEKEYYLSGETLIKAHFDDVDFKVKEFVSDSIRHPGCHTWFTGIYYFSLPSDFDFSYQVELPKKCVYKSGLNNADGSLVIFIDIDSSSITYTRANAAMGIIDKKINIFIYSASPLYISDSVAILNNFKNMMNSSYITYTIQKAIDIK